MADLTGHSVAAIQDRQAALLAQHSAVSDLDHVLREALAGAHAVTVEGLSRLDTIAQEIDSAVQNQAALALDTPVGRREFQKFLVSKQQEIVAVVTEARALDEAKRAVLQALRPQYTGSPAQEA
jgi:3-keto-L-gulonate-6-phosphate decarboxylase